ATAMGFKKIAKSEVINMVGRTSNISRTASVNVIVKERQDMTISTDDVLCNTDTARVGINTGYEVLNWYNVTNPEAEIMYDEDLAVLTEGTYIAVGTYELGACYDTLEVKVKDLAFYIPQDTTVCDSAILTIAKEDVIVMIDGEAIEGQTLVLTETGTYTIALVGVGDTCREEKILNLTVNPSYSISFDTIVYDSTFVWNEETYTATGNYTQFFTTINGCDSIVTANVTFVNTETEFALFGIVTEGDGTTPLADVEVSSEGTTVTTSNDGSYLIMIQRTNPVVHFSKPGYNIICDSVSGGGEYNVSMFKPEISVSLSDDSYETSPYVVREIVVELSNSGDGPLAWSSVIESNFTNNGRAVHPRSNSQMWEYADEVIVTNSNAEQAIATDGFYIYTASWRRAGEFNRYSPDNGYLETFVIDGVGGVRNLSYGNGLFFATDNTNKIYIINMDTQSLEDVITLNDPDLQIRYCTYSTEEDLLYIGNWTNLYKLVAYNTAYPTMIPLSYSMDNVYSIAYDAFSGSEPCLWAFSQVSENNGPFAKLYKLNKNGVQIAEMEHYINDESLASASSLAGGICVSQNLYDDKYVLLANIQNSNARNNIAVYEIGGKSSWVSTNTKGGVIPAGESINVVVTELATENGNYSAVVKFKPNVYMPQNTELNLSLAVSSPACSPVENLVAETDTFHVVNLSWDAVDAGDYERVSYLVYEQGSNVAIDTVQTTSYSVENAEVGNHCYYVRAFMRGETDCVSNPSNTACAEILAFPCDVQLSLTARAFGDRIRLEWNELFGVDHYEVQVDDLTGVILYNGSETIFEDTLALPETNNCYEVVAYFRNEECGSKRSNTACARISADGCSELPVVTATAVGNSVVLSWGKIQGVQSYSLYKDDKYITSTSDTVFYDMMLEYETEYCYVVEINCGYGMFGLSDEVCVTTEKEYEEQNAIESITNESIDIYPNPASDRFFVDGQQMQGLQIVNFAGQVVCELDNISEDRLMIDASAFAPGVYAVRIILSDSRSVVKRIVIGR
ncbi:MAG: T9SS type A sorting domain-containing protein, partial [Bacteroidales bacterium]|nr:T9SS type A sorting domain-containing protein [Bacteroidales bacterium]